jgi:hypothetical protein
MDPMSGATCQADKPLGVTKHFTQRNLWLPNRTTSPSFPRMRVASRDYPTEVAPAGRVLNKESQVATVVKRHLSPMDWLQPCCLGSVGEFHRAAEVVVVRQGQCAMTPINCCCDKLVGKRSPIVKRVRRVGVQFNVLVVHECARQTSSGCLKTVMLLPLSSTSSQ